MARAPIREGEPGTRRGRRGERPAAGRRWLRSLATAAAVVAAGLGAGFAIRALTDDDPGRGARPANAAGGDSSDAAPEPEQRRVRLTVSVSGDLLIHSPLLARALANGGGEYDFAPFFGAVRDRISRADLALCHLETPLGDGPPSTYPIFNTPTELAAAIRKTGWDACDTASNHSLDQGLEGVAATATALDRERIAHTGSFASARAAARPTIVTVNGIEVGLVAYTDSTNGIPPPREWAINEYDPGDPAAAARAILADARRARRRGAEAVIVNVHWGDENSPEPNASQLAVARRLTASPLVTAVVGQGPHVVQPIWRLNGKPVLFSSGNLVSNQSAAAGLPAATQDGIVATLRLAGPEDEIRLREITYAPVWVRPGDYVVLPARPGADPANAAALEESYERTVAVVGSGRGVGPAW